MNTYFAWVQKIQELDERLQDTVEQTISHSGPPYQALGSLVTELNTSKCLNLHRYASGCLGKWYQHAFAPYHTITMPL